MGRLPIKLIAIGNERVGKTSLLTACALGEFHPYSMVQIFDEPPQDIMFNDIPIRLAMYEAAYSNLEYIAPLRHSLLYPDTDVILLCFSLADPESYKHVRDYWYPEISTHAPNVPVILVGMKMDLLYDEETLTRLRERNMAPIDATDGETMCREINADKYMDCSSLQLMGVKEILGEAIGLVLQKYCHVNCLENKQCVLF